MKTIKKQQTAKIHLRPKRKAKLKLKLKLELNLELKLRSRLKLNLSNSAIKRRRQTGKHSREANWESNRLANLEAHREANLEANIGGTRAAPIRGYHPDIVWVGKNPNKKPVSGIIAQSKSQLVHAHDFTPKLFEIQPSTTEAAGRHPRRPHKHNRKQLGANPGAHPSTTEAAGRHPWRQAARHRHNWAPAPAPAPAPPKLLGATPGAHPSTAEAAGRHPVPRPKGKGAGKGPKWGQVVGVVKWGQGRRVKRTGAGS